MTDVADLDRQVMWHPFTQMADWLAEPPLVIAAAEGCTLIDVEGRLRSPDDVPWSDRVIEVPFAPETERSGIAESSRLVSPSAPRTSVAVPTATAGFDVIAPMTPMATAAAPMIQAVLRAPEARRARRRWRGWPRRGRRWRRTGGASAGSRPRRRGRARPGPPA